MGSANSTSTARASSSDQQRKGDIYFNLSPSRNIESNLAGKARNRLRPLKEVLADANEAMPPEDSEAWRLHRLGLLQAAKGLLKASSSHLRHAAEADPADARHRFVLSEIQQHRGEANAALVEAARATRCPNAQPWHFHHYGVLLAERGIFEQAR